MRTFRKPAALRVLGLTGAVAATALLLAACGDGDTMGGMDHGGTTSATAAPSAPGNSGTFNEADVMFAQMMIPHHEQALKMAELAEGRAEDPDVKRIVAAIEKAQDPEIQKMKAWLRGWGKPETAAMDHGMAGMMSEQDMKDLAAVQGRDFDRKFAELMIAHHEGAVEMAKTEQKAGGNTEAKALAGEVVTAQTAEIAELRKILDRL
ncbi:DUF305 domain-containing protein [Streptomyces roseolus]|uniref:DUF305 domain-containing protein n=1 Tax=Streptomyces roseolus TaxID=67358 RepID=UPI0036E4991D